MKRLDEAMNKVTAAAKSIGNEIEEVTGAQFNVFCRELGLGDV